MSLEKFNSPEVKSSTFDPDKRLEHHNEIEGKELPRKFNPDQRIEKTRPEKYYTTAEERIKQASYSKGEWQGRVGRSAFKPNSPEARAEMKKFNVTEIPYSNGNPDFRKVSLYTVKVEGMTSKRPQNFEKANEKVATIWNKENREGRGGWKARDVENWRKENELTWHECIDRTTMNLVPRSIHGACNHEGGVAECKRAEAVGGKIKYDE